MDACQNGLAACSDSKIMDVNKQIRKDKEFSMQIDANYPFLEINTAKRE